MTTRRVFIAGSTGATGRTVVRLAERAGVEIVPHQRPKRTAEGNVDPRAVVLDLADAPGLGAAMRKCTTVMQLIGTVRSRFSRGDTYETSDIGTTRQLVDAAKLAGSIDHIVLLSSVGAGKNRGAYLKAKAIAEEIVRESGIAYTIFRPSTFVGEGHRAPPGFGPITKLFGLSSLRPIDLEDLAAALLRCAADRAPLATVLEGDSLWELVARARTALAGR